MKYLRYLSVIAGLAGALLLGATGKALANQYTVYSCHDPAGAAVGDFGWTPEHAGGTGIVLGDSCASSGAGALVSELPGRAGGYANLERGQWTFLAPSGTSIARYSLHIAGSYAQPLESGGAGAAAVWASDESDPTYDFRNLAGGTGGALSVNREPPGAVSYLIFDASCDSGCGYNIQYVARIDVSQTTILLDDSTAPKVANVSGPLVSGKPLSGAAEASYEASDSGPGIYAAHFVVDGQVQPTVLLDSGQATCTNLGETEDGTRAFDSPEPCAKALDATSGLETTNWVDGEHHVQLIVEDASGNSVTAFNGTVTFHNAPSATVEPTLGPALGSHEEYSPEDPSENTLEGAPASFTAPTGAGNVTSESHWERCDAGGANCAPIAGATGGSYALSAADVGHTIRYQSTGRDKDGSTSVASPQSAVISERQASSHSGPGNEAPIDVTGNTSTTNNTTNNSSSSASYPPAEFQFTGLTGKWLSSRNGITRRYPKSALKFTGRLLSPSGQALGGQTIYLLSGPLGGGLHAIASTKANPNGNWTLKAPKGPSRLLRVAYGPQEVGASGTQLTRDFVEHVRPTVTLGVSSEGDGLLVFRGRVGFAALKPSLLGVIQAREGNRWQDVGTPDRTGRKGAFSARYSASELIGHTYTFRLFVPSTHESMSASSRSIAATVR